MDEISTFVLDKFDGSLYANKSYDREEQSEYNIYVFATHEPDYYPDHREILNELFVIQNNSIATITVHISDENDNPPKFNQTVYYSAISDVTNINDSVITIGVYDLDLKNNSLFSLFIKSAYLFKYGTDRSLGPIFPSPFNISMNGEIKCLKYMYEYKQHRFLLEVAAQENAYPERQVIVPVYVSINFNSVLY